MDESMQKTRAADEVVKVLEQKIYSGVWHSGQMLPPERELVDEFGISRTVAREAVKILEMSGLIEARPRHRPVVRSPNFDVAFGMLGKLVQHLIEQKGGVKLLFDIRIFVETGLVRYAAIHANKDDIARLKKALAENEASIDDSKRFYETDMAFHNALYIIPKNPIFPALHKSFCEWLQKHWLKMPRLPDRNAGNYHAHHAIYQAILERDPDTGEKALKDHLNSSWQQVENTFIEENLKD